MSIAKLLENTRQFDMSQPQLKLVWVNKIEMSSRSARRKRLMTAQQNIDPQPPVADGGGESAWKQYFDKKQIGTALVLLVAGAILLGIWTLFSEFWENRIIKRIERDDGLALKIAKKIEESKTLPAAIVEQLKTSDEFKQMKVLTGEVTRIDNRLSYLEGRIDQVGKIAYGTKASALGITNPSIQTVSLQPQEVIVAPPVASGNFRVFVRYTILSIQGDIIKVLVAGRDSRNNVAERNVFALRVTPGTVRKIGPLFPGWPTLAIAILDRPNPDTAVFALGQPDTPKT